jgi:HK97 gp10 family phage protein
MQPTDMVQVQVTLRDATRWKAAFQRAPDAARREVNFALTDSVTRVAAQAVRNAPVNKQTGGGNLRQSIRSTVSGLRGQVYTDSSYAVYVHEGTRPHLIRPRGPWVLQNKRTGEIFGRLVRHPGTRAQPFLRTAAEDSRSYIERTFSDALARVASSIHP